MNVRKHFGIGQYHDVHLITDVLLLTDAIEIFTDLCVEDYGLDPAHYCALPNFCNATRLKTGVHGQEMYELLERGLRGVKFIMN